MHKFYLGLFLKYDHCYSIILFISVNSSFVISPLTNLNFNALSGSSFSDCSDVLADGI